MTAIFRDMLATADALGPTWPSSMQWLHSKDPGENLAAIAYGYAHPKSFTLAELMDSAEKLSQPFLQYWILRVILHKVETQGDALSADDLGQMRKLASSFADGSDRRSMAEAILRMAVSAKRRVGRAQT